MTLLNAIKAFVNPPSESESGQASSDERQAEHTPSNESGSEQALAVSENQNQPATTDNGETTNAPAPGAVTEGKDSPYRMVPTEANRLSGYEIEQLGYAYDEDGELEEEQEMFMGEWPRNMIETKLNRPKDPTWFGYVDDSIKGVDSAPIEFERLFRHITVFGETGSGKSTLLTNLMTQWIFGGHGVCFIDPKGGGDAKELVQRIPEHRKDDLIWIEPGSTRDRMIGFNLLETDSSPGDPDFDNEVQSVVKQFSEVIKNTSSGEGAVIDEVVEEVTRFLVKQEYNYNVLDLYAILFDESDRQQLPEDVTDQFDKKALQSIADKDDEDLNSIKRRVRPWVTDMTTRNILDVRNSGINITQAMEEDKIIIVDVGRIQSPDVLQMFVTALVRRMWSTVKRRDEEEDDHDPFFLVVDEFKQVAIDRLGIGKMMSEARAYNFSITLATQQPSQLDKDVLESVFGNSKNILTYKSGSRKDNKVLGDEIGMTAKEIKNLLEYQIAGQVISRGKEVSITAKTFPPYPPLHTPQEAEAMIEQSLHRYGKQSESKKWEDAELSDYGVHKADAKSEEKSEKIVINKNHEITVPEFLRLIFTAQAKYSTRSFDGEDGYVSKDDIRNIVEERYGEFASSTKLSQLLTETLDSNWRKNKMDGGVYTKLSEAGEAVAFEQDSGDGGGGGKDKHRHVLSVAWREFTKLGYDMDIPNQDEWGDEPPDGIAIPPIQPVKESNNSAEFYQLESLLQSEYPRIYELFGDLTVSIEAETTTQTKPSQTIKNLSKAVRRNQKCAFVTLEYVDDDEDENPYEKRTPLEAMDRAGAKIHDILTNPPFVNKMDGQNRVFYNYSSGKNIQMNNGRTALQKDTGGKRTTWKEDGNKIVFDNGTGETSTFRNASQLEKPTKDKFNYSYKNDKRRNVTVVYDSKDNIVEEYDSVTQMEKDGWKTVIAPCIPELLFDLDDPDKKYPDEDAWKIFVVPRASNPEFDSDTVYLYKPYEKNMEDRFEPLVSASQAEEEERDAEERDAEESSGVQMPTIGSGDDSSTSSTESSTETQTDDVEETDDTPEPPSQSKPTTTEDDESTSKPTEDTNSPPTESKPTESKPTASKPNKNKPTDTTETSETSEASDSEPTENDDAWSDYKSTNDAESSKPTESDTESASKPSVTKPTESKPTESTNTSTKEDTESVDETAEEDTEPEPVETEDETEKTEEDSETTADNEDDEDEVDDDDVWGDYKSSSVDL